MPSAIVSFHPRPAANTRRDALYVIACIVDMPAAMRTMKFQSCDNFCVSDIVSDTQKGRELFLIRSICDKKAILVPICVKSDDTPSVGRSEAVAFSPRL